MLARARLAAALAGPWDGRRGLVSCPRNRPRTAVLTNLQSLAGTQHLAPLASGGEYSFMLDDAAGKTIAVERFHELPGSSASVGTLFQ